MIGFSPRGAIDVLMVFPVMMAIALALDILDLVLVVTIVGATILNIIGFLTIGLWIIIRSGGENSGEARKEQKKESKKEGQAAGREGTSATAKEGEKVAAEEGERVAAKEGEKVAAKGAGRSAGKGLGKALLRVGIIGGLELIPAVNSIFFGWTIMVLWEAYSDFKNFSMEKGD